MAPLRASGAISVVNAKVPANISIDLPTSPIILTFSSFSSSKFLVPKLIPAISALNVSAMSGVPITATINNGVANTIYPANLSIDLPTSPNRVSPVAKPSILALVSSPESFRLFTASTTNCRPLPSGSIEGANIAIANALPIPGFEPPLPSLISSRAVAISSIRL